MHECCHEQSTLHKATTKIKTDYCFFLLVFSDSGHIVFAINSKLGFIRASQDMRIEDLGVL